ncbi:MAG TPA: enoyl-CoA hydratase [Solirubrobacteraceae bacterium]|nr:enoyl-CoA hydratase [Solirubrobacteraceae bacterium]
MNNSQLQLETVALSVEEQAATIELNRPQALNAWNRQLGEDLLTALRTVAQDDEVRAVRITGAGRAFSSGADLKDVTSDDLTPDGKPDVYKQLTEVYHPVMVAIRELPKPVVAAVNGPAVGIGCSLALCCDLVIAAESAYFLLAFVNIGLVADGGSSLFVPARVGVARAAEMALLGERIDAAKALQWGLINEACPDESFSERSRELTARLGRGATRAYAATKRELNARVYAGMAEQLELEASLQQEMVGTADFVEGVSAFLQKRDAVFSGR